MWAIYCSLAIPAHAEQVRTEQESSSVTSLAASSSSAAEEIDDASDATRAKLLAQAVQTSLQNSDNESALNKLAQINKKIVLKQIELERFNVNFRKETNVQGRWRGPRYFLSQGTNSICTASGLWAATAIRAEPIKRPYYLALNRRGRLQVNRKTPFRVGLEEAVATQLIGEILAGVGSAVELGINLYHDHHAQKHGFDEKTALKYVKTIKDEMRSLFAERESLLASANLSPSCMEIAGAQGKVLDDLAKLALNEFCRFDIGARRFKTFQNTLYVMDIAKNSIGSVGLGMNLYVGSRKRPRALLPAGILVFTSGAFIAATPICSRIVGKLNSVRHKRSLASLMDQSATLAKLNGDRNELATKIGNAKGSLDSNQLFLNQVIDLDAASEIHSKLHQRKFDLAVRELRAGQRAATENVFTGLLAGSTKMTLGTCTMIAGARYPKYPIRVNTILYAGQIVHGCGSSFAALDNIRIQVRNELERRKFSKEQLLPGQVFKAHLDELKTLETRLVSGKIVR